MDALALLDSSPFTIFPGTNHFGDDDFHVLHAEVPLLDYEDFRLAQPDRRQAARQLAEAITESSELYIRFVAVRLQTVDPDGWDVFVCHASEDKKNVARPLHSHLTGRGVGCWLDEAEIAWGESIIGKIQDGLAKARYVIVVLSPHLLQKNWAQKDRSISSSIHAATNNPRRRLLAASGVVLSSHPFTEVSIATANPSAPDGGFSLCVTRM